jgi:hypothetical protein
LWPDVLAWMCTAGMGRTRRRKDDQAEYGARRSMTSSFSYRLKLKDCPQFFCAEASVQNDFSAAPVRAVAETVPLNPSVSVLRYYVCGLFVHVRNLVEKSYRVGLVLLSVDPSRTARCHHRLHDDCCACRPLACANGIACQVGSPLQLQIQQGRDKYSRH